MASVFLARQASNGGRFNKGCLVAASLIVSVVVVFMLTKSRPSSRGGSSDATDPFLRQPESGGVSAKLNEVTGQGRIAYDSTGHPVLWGEQWLARFKTRLRFLDSEVPALSLVPNLKVLVDPTNNITILAHNNLPYFDGDRAQQRIIDRVFAASCKADRAEEEGANIVVDVGGLYGDFSLRAAAAGCYVICFEPQPTYASLIRASAALNGLLERVNVIPAAVAPNDNAVYYYQAGDHNGNTYFKPEKPAKGISYPVKTYSLDKLFMDGPQMLYLKVDVEGFDVAVLRSAEALLRAGRIKHLHFEYTTWFVNPGQGEWKEVLYFLRGLPKPPRLYALHRTEPSCFGPVRDKQLDEFHASHLARHLQTDVFATFDDSFDPGCDKNWTAKVFA